MSTAPGFPPSEYVSIALWAPFSKIVGITAITNQVPNSCLTGTLSTGFKGSSFVEPAPMLASAVRMRQFMAGEACLAWQRRAWRHCTNLACINTLALQAHSVQLSAAAV